MKKIPLRLILPIFIPIGILTWFLSNYFYLDLELKKEPDKWSNFKYQLQNTEVSYRGQKIPIPITLDQSFTHWGDVSEEEIILHFIQTQEKRVFTICRSSAKDFWIHSGFSDNFMRHFGVADTLDKFDILFSLLRNKLADRLQQLAVHERGTRRENLQILARKSVLSEQEMLFLLDNGILTEQLANRLWFENGYNRRIPLLEIFELIIPFKMRFPLIYEHFQNQEHYFRITKRIWRFEHFLFRGVALVMFCLGIFGTYFMGWKDLLILGYRFNTRMKMLHWWHYVTMFLPKTESKIEQHFKLEYKNYIERKKEEKLRNFVKNRKIPDSVNERKLKNILQYEGKKEAKIYCLRKMNVYQASSFAGRDFLIKNFYNFLKLNRKEQKTVAHNLAYLKNLSDVSLENLTREKITEPKRQPENFSPYDSFLEKLPARYHPYFIEHEFLLKDFNYDLIFVDCFCDNKETTYLNILKKQNHILLGKLRLDKTRYDEIINILDDFQENDLCSVRTILYEIKEKKIRWESRDKYLNLILNKNFPQIEQELRNEYSSTPTSDYMIDSETSEKSAEIEADKSVIKGKSFLIVANFITSTKADSLVNAFEKSGAAAFVTTKIPKKNPKDVDIVLLMTGYMKHGIGYYFKKKFSSYLRMSHIDVSIVIDNVCEILSRSKPG